MLQFGRPLDVHHHVLLATLDLDKKRFKLDSSKLAMHISDPARDKLRRDISEHMFYSQHDLYIDLREPLLPGDLATLIRKLSHLNGIIGVHMERVWLVNYSFFKIGSLLQSGLGQF